jgi:hypothetical protein
VRNSYFCAGVIDINSSAGGTTTLAGFLVTPICPLVKKEGGKEAAFSAACS